MEGGVDEGVKINNCTLRKREKVREKGWEIVEVHDKEVEEETKQGGYEEDDVMK